MFYRIHMYVQKNNFGQQLMMSEEILVYYDCTEVHVDPANLF